MTLKAANLIERKIEVKVSQIVNQINEAWTRAKDLKVLEKLFTQDIVLLVSDNRKRIVGIKNAIRYYKSCSKLEVIKFKSSKEMCKRLDEESLVYSYEYAMEYKHPGEDSYKSVKGYDAFIFTKVGFQWQLVLAIV